MSQQQVKAGAAGQRSLVERIPVSQIREVANTGMDLDDVIALWYGEPDLPTADFINKAATESLARGETFYTQNRGVEELRETIAAYMSGLHERPVAVDRVTVTASGMSSLNLVQQVLTDPGDNVVVVGPIWPNLIQTVAVMGGEPRIVSLRFGNDGWTLDLDQLFDRVDARTRAIMINSPGNPTGWMMSREAQKAVLEFCRERGIWLISDEVYSRVVYDRKAAPSVIDIAEPEDRVIAINSFSKSWSMTGWRLGWLAAPASLGPTLEKMIEFHYSCPAHFTQMAGIVAIRDGEALITETVDRYRRARDLTTERLQAFPRIRFQRPDAAFYAFFALDGMDNSLEWCKRAVTEAHVGLAPGTAFGEEGEGHIRLCFASTLERLDQAFDRLTPMLN